MVAQSFEKCLRATVADWREQVARGLKLQPDKLDATSQPPQTTEHHALIV